jgi:hypothetical protein
MYIHENEAILPECVEVDLRCEECVRSSASTTAMFCSSLGADGIGIAFRLMYQRPECQSMHSAFYFHYRLAAQAKSADVLAGTA